jgi:uncharacterized OB-fold protein
MTTDKPTRPYPVADAETEFHWEAARLRELHIARCAGCSQFIHPPRGMCPRCWSDDIRPERVSGRGTVYTYAWNEMGGRAPGWDGGYLTVVVELDEQPHLRMLTQLVNCDPRRVAIGMRVRVTFEEIGGGIILPQFEPNPEP